jgi:hypothetical protein
MDSADTNFILCMVIGLRLLGLKCCPLVRPCLIHSTDGRDSQHTDRCMLQENSNGSTHQSHIMELKQAHEFSSLVVLILVAARVKKLANRGNISSALLHDLANS